MTYPDTTASLRYFMQNPDAKVGARKFFGSRMLTEINRAIARREPPTDHFDAVRFIAITCRHAGVGSQIEPALILTKTRRIYPDVLIGKVGAPTFVVEYKPGPLTPRKAVDAQRQVLRYVEALGCGSPVVVVGHRGADCPTVPTFTIDEFCAPYLDEVHRIHAELDGAA